MRGAHHFWLSGKIRESSSSPNGLINLVHYDDAAEAVMSAFKEAAASEPLLVEEATAAAEKKQSKSTGSTARSRKNCPFSQRFLDFTVQKLENLILLLTYLQLSRKYAQINY